MNKRMTWLGLLAWLAAGPGWTSAAELINPDWVGARFDGASLLLWGTDGAFKWSGDGGATWTALHLGERPVDAAAIDPRSGRWMGVSEGRLVSGIVSDPATVSPAAAGWRVEQVGFDAAARRWSAWGCEEAAPARCAVLHAEQGEDGTPGSWQRHGLPAVQGWRSLTRDEAGHAVSTDQRGKVHFSEGADAPWRTADLAGAGVGEVYAWHRAEGIWVGLTPDQRALRLDSVTGRAGWVRLPRVAAKQNAWTAVAYDGRGALMLGSADGRIALSRDRGRSFSAQPSTPLPYVVQLCFDAANDEWLALGNDGSLHASRDGTQWRQVADFGPARPRGIGLRADGAGLVWGHGGLLAHRVGRTDAWRLLRPDLSRYVHDMQPTAAGGALAVGASGLIARAADARALANDDWQLIDAGLGHHQFLLSTASYPGGQDWIAAGSAATVVRSGDGGRSWQVVYRNADGALGNFQRVAIHPRSKVALIVANPGWTMRSRDEGRSWQPVDGQVKRLNDLAAVAQAGFVAVGAGGQILLFDAQGEFQRRVPAPASTAWQNVRVLPDAVWVLGDGDTALRLSLDLSRVQTVALGRRLLLRDVLASNEGQVLLFAGADGAVLRSTDGGASLHLVEGLPNANYRRILRTGEAGPLWLTGRGGVLLRSDDEGRNWRQIATGTAKHFKSMLRPANDGDIVLYGDRLVRVSPASP